MADETAADAKKGTEYVILERRGGIYRIAGRREAFGAHAAIRAHRKEDASGAGPEAMVAVPVSNWTEVVVEVEQPEPILRLVDIPIGGSASGRVASDFESGDAA